MFSLWKTVVSFGILLVISQVISSEKTLRKVGERVEECSLFTGGAGLGCRVWKCFGGYFNDDRLCEGGSWINVTGAEFAISACPPQDTCCPAEGDCRVPVVDYKRGHMDHIYRQCNGKYQCDDLRADRAGPLLECSNEPSDYELIYYDCISWKITGFEYESGTRNVHISWDKLVGAEGYIVVFDGKETKFKEDEVSHNFTSLTPGSLYYVYITSCTGCSDSSPVLGLNFSSPVKTLPAAPKDFKANPLTDATSVELTWSDPEEGLFTMYDLSYDGKNQSIGRNETSWIVEDLTSDKKYEFFLTSVSKSNGFGDAYSDTKFSETYTHSKPVHNLAIKDVNSSSLTVSWEKPANDDGDDTIRGYYLWVEDMNYQTCIYSVELRTGHQEVSTSLDSICNRLYKTAIAAIDDSYEFTTPSIAHLQASTSYSVTVTVVSGAGDSEPQTVHGETKKRILLVIVVPSAVITLLVVLVIIAVFVGRKWGERSKESEGASVDTDNDKDVLSHVNQGLEEQGPSEENKGYLTPLPNEENVPKTGNEYEYLTTVSNESEKAPKAAGPEYLTPLPSEPELRPGKEKYINLTTKHDVLEHLSTNMRNDVERFVMDVDGLHYMSSLGKGHFGKVYLCKLLRNNQTCKVAVKSLKGGGFSKPIELKAFLEEALRIKDFRNDHILSPLGIVFHQGNPKIVLPYMEKGDLKSLLSKKISSNEQFDLVTLVGFCRDVAAGMSYLSRQKFAHMDLAARNCMVDNELVVKIGDFGMTHDLYEKSYYKMSGGKPLPVRWMSPESLMNNVFTCKSDRWSYGVVMWEIFTHGEKPYKNLDNNQFLKSLTGQNFIHLDSPDICPPEIYSMMCECWSKDPDARPRFSKMKIELDAFISCQTQTV